MKKLKLNKKLSLNKETVSELGSEQMGAVKGGATSIGSHCTHAHNGCFGKEHTNSAFCGNNCH